MQVTLRTMGGAFIAVVRLLPFVEPPDCVVWGDRIFMLATDNDYHEASVGRVFEQVKPAVIQ